MPPRPGAGGVRRRLLALALAVASLAGSVLLAEALFRVYERHFLVEEVAVGADDFDLAALRYNDAQGHLPPAKPPDEFRILSFGDSFAESATRAEYAYAAVLQQALSELSARHVRVVNFGVGMSTFQDYIEEERSWGSRVEHDAVLFNLYAGNDFAEVPQHALYARGQARAPRKRGGAERRLVGPGVEVPRRYPLRLLDHALAQYLTHTQDAPQQDFYRERTPQAPRRIYVRTQAAMSDYYRADRMQAAYAGSLYALDALISRAAALERRGRRVALSVAPPDFAVSPEWLEAVRAATGLAETELRLDLPDQIVAALAARRGFAGPLVVFHACLREAEAQGQDTYYGTNTHWSVRGNQIVGRVLAERLAAAWRLGDAHGAWSEPPPPCRSEPPQPSPEVLHLLDTTLPRLDAAARLRDRVGAALAGEGFESFEAIAAALARAGLRHAPERLRGRIESASARGVGRVPVRMLGVARDLEQPEAWLLVPVFRGGALRGIGLTPPDSAAAGGAFAFDVVDEVGGPWWGRGVVAVAISPDGAFAQLDVETGTLLGLGP